MLTEIGKRVKNAAAGLAVASTDDKNKILKDKLRMLGYADSQFTSLLLSFNKIDKLLPKDMLEDVAMCSDGNIIAYNRIKEVLY